MILCENCVHLKTWMFAFAVHHSQTVHATLMGGLVQEGHAPHFSISGDHVVNVFSFSKASQIVHGESLWQASGDFHCKHEAFGMMGWRIGQVLARRKLLFAMMCFKFQRKLLTLLTLSPNQNQSPIVRKPMQWHVVRKKVTTRGMILVTYDLHLYVCLHGILEATWTGPQCS